MTHHELGNPRRLAVGLALAFALVAPGIASAQAAYRMGFGATGGVIMPLGAINDLHDAGWQLSALADWWKPARTVGFRAEVSYARLGGQSIGLGSTTVSGSNLGLFSVVGDALVMLRSDTASVSPYLIGGLGVYHTSDHRTAVSGDVSNRESNTSTKLGLNAGLGIERRLAGARFFAEARLHSVFGGALGSQGGRKDAVYLPITVGVRVGGP